MILGSGDGVINFYNSLGPSTNELEHIYLISDGNIYFYVNNQNTSNRKAAMVFEGSSGYAYAMNGLVSNKRFTCHGEI
jgi:hypothetical protein